jgi:hypothetical protein
MQVLETFTSTHIQFTILRLAADKNMLNIKWGRECLHALKGLAKAPISCQRSVIEQAT